MGTLFRRGRRPGSSFTAGLEKLESRLAMAAAAPLPVFDVGSPTLVDIWVDPSVGSDAASGRSRSEAVRTLSEAWRRIPAAAVLTEGVRINLVAGTYAASIVPNYWENRLGTLTAPIIVRAADGAGTARLPTVNVFGCRFLYFDGLDISARGGDVLHFEACSHILLRDTTVRGLGTLASYDVPQEALKVNQCQHVYIEDCDISGAWDNAVDFVAVQYGHVVGSRIHRAGDWAMYAKGGSAQLTIRGNEFFDAGTGGFTAGQGTGFEFMVAPWLQYEAYDITFTDNVVHDTEGAGIGVNGGVNIVMSDNVLYRVGARSHVIEVGFGSRSCDGDAATCRALLAQGGWGTATVGAEVPIPNANVIIANNVVLNPDGFQSQWQHLALAGPRATPTGSNIPAPARADTGLRLFGNVIWNGPADLPLGIEAPLLAADILDQNAINTVRPVLVNPAGGDYRVVPVDGLPPPTPPTPPAPPLAARFAAIAAVTSRQMRSFVVTFDRAVSGVTLDDFVLARGGRRISLAGARITTTDNVTFTLSDVSGTRVAGRYALRLKASGTGIADAWASALAQPTSVSWRMAPVKARAP